jgi:hypothetical protein
MMMDVGTLAGNKDSILVTDPAGNISKPLSYATVSDESIQQLVAPSAANTIVQLGDGVIDKQNSSLAQISSPKLLIPPGFSIATAASSGIRAIRIKVGSLPEARDWL